VDNTPLMEQILALRFELANLVGFANYAEYSLATKMAKSVVKWRVFWINWRRSVSPRATRVRRTDATRRSTAQRLGCRFLWRAFEAPAVDLSEEALRPYFPAPRVLQGMFAVAEKLYGVRIVERNGIDLYHEDAKFFDILNADGTRRGSFFVDLYARPKKRGGAWMDECVGRMSMSGSQHLPVAYLVCNFMPPSADKPALLTHSKWSRHSMNSATVYITCSRASTIRASPASTACRGMPWSCQVSSWKTLPGARKYCADLCACGNRRTVTGCRTEALARLA